MNEVQIITNGYKKQFIDEILNGMEHFLDNSQLMELNKSLNHHTNNLTITEAPSNIDLDFKKTDQILIKDFLKHKKNHASAQLLQYPSINIMSLPICKFLQTSLILD